MCGIAGLLGHGFGDGLVEDMLTCMHLRGPDGSGVWRELDQEVQLGHARLAIIDLITGDQPMRSPDGRYVIVFNGEIYNYLELKPALEAKGWRFRTASDTEVLLAGLVLEGEAFLSNTIGMFAIALWDRQERRLFLARDRMGIKPLYYAETPDGLAFGSELKALAKIPKVDCGIDLDALESYLRLRYTPAPATILRGVRKFPAAHYAWITPGREWTPVQWWDVHFSSVDRGIPQGQLNERLDWLLRDAVRLCMRSDVPYGAFLSGGVDSGVVTGLMADLAGEPVRTYSVGFRGLMDEREDAAATARAIGTQHQAFELSPEDLRSLPSVICAVDEPFPDPIVLAMDRLAGLAGHDVKVILTGEGADELFGGYVHHPHMLLLDRLSRWVPQGLLDVGSCLAAHVPVGLVNRYFDYPAPPGRKARDRLARVFRCAKDETERYMSYVSVFGDQDLDALLTGEVRAAARGSATKRVAMLLGEGDGAFIDRLWRCEYKTWLTDNILFKQDKTLMAHSVEGRVPFCDHRLVEFAAALPLSARLNWGMNKVALRHAARRLVPALPDHARKRAFMIPLDGSYGAVIREMACDLLNSARFRGLGLFRPQAVDALLDEFPAPSFLVGKQILSLTMFALWEREVLACRR
jgi:asparagine synthase (glutamine-hydrolysing)